MLILQHPALKHAWSHKFTCECGAVLLANIGDIKSIFVAGTIIKKSYRFYYVTCPVCDLWEELKRLPKRTKNIINSLP